MRKQGKVRRNLKESPGNEANVARARDAKRGALRGNDGAMEMEVQGKRNRGRPKGRWLDRVRDAWYQREGTVGGKARTKASRMWSNGP